MWTYAGKDDPMRVSAEDYSTNELEKTVRSFTWLTQKDDIPTSCQVTPFDKEHPPAADQDHLRCYPPLLEGGEVPEAAADPEGDTETIATEENMIEEDSSAESSYSLTLIPSAHSQDEAVPKGKRKRADADENSGTSSTSQPKLVQPTRDEDESPKSPPAGRAKILEAPASTPMKPMNPREQTADSAIPKDPAAGPEPPPKKKSKKSDSNKGIKIAENPTVPAVDDPIMREMVDMATRCIGFQDKASNLEATAAALKNSEEIREDAMKHAEALEAKLEAAEKALKEAQEKAQSEEERWEEENARLATREKDIRERLDALISSLVKVTDYSLQLGKGQEVDPLLDSLSVLEGNRVQARNLLTRSRQAFKRIHGHLFPK
ncbi:hypothetical protein ACQ4PT_069675 [Festuca glaucescens]